MKTKNKKGIALLSTLLFTVIIYGLCGVFVLRVVNEKNLSRIERETFKSFYAAQGGAEIALTQLGMLINTYLQDTISSASPSGVISYAQSKVSSGDGIGWLVYAVRNNNEIVLTQDGDEALYSQSDVMGDVNYNFTITITEKEDPSSSGVDVWDFPYSYIIESTSTDNGMSRKVVLNGDFTVRVQKDNFAKYALFTNSQTTPSGSNVWFTNKTNFSGPLHTNGRYNFAFNPSGTFEDAIQQKEQLARFYNNGWTVLIDADSNGTRDVPVFNNGFSRDVDEVVASSTTLESDMVYQASSGATISGNGIYVSNDGSALTGGIYVEGNCTLSLGVDGNNNAVYVVNQGSTTKNITVDVANNQTSIETVGGGTEVYTGIPDGVDDAGSLVYVNGDITSLGGTVQQNTELTIATNNDVVISDDILYSDYDPGSGTAGQAGYVAPSVSQVSGETKNLLGIVSWQGDVLIGTSAPDDVNIHGTILSSNGIFTVDNYNKGSPRGTATTLGGVITNNYGAFGLFSGSTGNQLTGYGRNFTYDQRMQEGKSPPYFPTLNTFVAFTNDITDKIVWREGE